MSTALVFVASAQLSLGKCLYATISQLVLNGSLLAIQQKKNLKTKAWEGGKSEENVHSNAFNSKVKTS